MRAWIGARVGARAAGLVCFFFRVEEKPALFSFLLPPRALKLSSCWRKSSASISAVSNCFTFAPVKSTRLCSRAHPAVFISRSLGGLCLDPLLRVSFPAQRPEKIQYRAGVFATTGENNVATLWYYCWSPRLFEASLFGCV